MKTATRPRILLVDDETHQRENLATALRSVGFLVEVARTGCRAVISADEVPPDLVILDVHSPDLDGFEVTGLLRTRGIGAPVLFLSAREGPQDELAGLSVGGDAYLSRQKVSAELISRVAPILQQVGVHVGDDELLRCEPNEAVEGHRRHPPAHRSPTLGWKGATFTEQATSLRHTLAQRTTLRFPGSTPSSHRWLHARHT